MIDLVGPYHYGTTTYMTVYVHVWPVGSTLTSVTSQESACYTDTMSTIAYGYTNFQSNGYNRGISHASSSSFSPLHLVLGLLHVLWQCNLCASKLNTWDTYVPFYLNVTHMTSYTRFSCFLFLFQTFESWEESRHELLGKIFKDWYSCLYMYKTVYHSTSSEQTCMHTIAMVQYGNGR